MKDSYDSDLIKELDECRESAQKGYDIASAINSKVRGNVKDAQDKIQGTIDDLKRNRYYRSGTLKALSQQMVMNESAFNDLYTSVEEDLSYIKERRTNFSITLFGKSNVGKSTLKEFLTHGNGSSIGKGAQGTTKDVRKYNWKGLTITDIPGFGVPDREEDERLAMDAARPADLILFLITDDAPSDNEAFFMSKIINMGKPVICVINVKATISEDRDIDEIQERLDDCFEFDRLQELRDQFVSYGPKYSQNWEKIPSVYVHLWAAFLAQRCADVEKSEFLYTGSRIKALTDLIEDNVRERGRFLCLKTFIDAISVKVLENEKLLLMEGLANSRQVKLINDKRKELATWNNQYHRDSASSIDTFLSGIRNTLYDRAYRFSEDHYDDEEVDVKWRTLLSGMKLEEKCQHELDILLEQCDNKLLDVSKEIEFESQYVTNQTFSLPIRPIRIHDYKRAVSLGTRTVGVVLTGASFIGKMVGKSKYSALLTAAGGAIFAAGEIMSGFMPDQDEKIKKARKELYDQLEADIDEWSEQTSTFLHEALKDIVEKRIQPLLSEMQRASRVVDDLSLVQLSLARDMNQQLLSLNARLLTEAVEAIGSIEQKKNFVCIARIPGNEVLIALRKGNPFPEKVRQKLSELLSENIGTIVYSEKNRTMVSRTMGRYIDRNRIKLEQRVGIAYITLLEEAKDIGNRIDLAGQLTGLIILMEDPEND